MTGARRRWWGLGFLALLIAEIAIALFLHDPFIRPYGGDILVVILLYCGVRFCRPAPIPWLPLWIFLFAVLVEAAQGIHLLARLGLDGIPFLRVLCGTSFSPWDLLCYAAGCSLCIPLQKY